VPTRLEAGTLLYQGLVMTAVAFVLWYRGVERLGPDRAGVTMAAAPLAAAGVAALVGTGSLGVRTVVGAVLVAAAVALALRPSSGPSTRDPSHDVSTPVVSHSS
jgi:drug/metabolite transporter (DMT)-like permease